MDWIIDFTAASLFDELEKHRRVLRDSGIDPASCVIAYMGPAGLGTGSVCCQILLPDGKAAVIDFAPVPNIEHLKSDRYFEELSQEEEGPDLTEARQQLQKMGDSFDSLVIQHYAAHADQMW